MGSKVTLPVIAVMVAIACSYTPLTLAPTPSPRPKPTAIPTPAPLWIQIGYWDDSPSDHWADGTTIIMYRADGRVILKTHYLDGSNRVQELVRSATKSVRYDILDDVHGFYLLKYQVLGLYDETGLVWEAECGDPYYLDALRDCQSP